MAEVLLRALTLTLPSLPVLPGPRALSEAPRLSPLCFLLLCLSFPASWRLPGMRSEGDVVQGRMDRTQRYSTECVIWYTITGGGYPHIGNPTLPPQMAHPLRVTA